jgi:hypothetical protein
MSNGFDQGADSRKPKPRQCSYYLCDHCNQPIINPDDGLVFQGNVYVADPKERGGLIGNNFPVVKPFESIKIEDVSENVFCHQCVLTILQLDRHYEAKQLNRSRPSTSMSRY